LKDIPFWLPPIGTPDSNLNPRNIQYNPVIDIFTFTRSKPGIFGLTLSKIEHFSKVSMR